MSITEGWLNCEISKGMLPKEYAVVCTSLDNSTYSFFAYHGLVDVEKNSVKVNILEWKDDFCLVNLPVVPFENHGRTIKVSKALVTTP